VLAADQTLARDTKWSRYRARIEAGEVSVGDPGGVLSWEAREAAFREHVRGLAGAGRPEEPRSAEEALRERQLMEREQRKVVSLPPRLLAVALFSSRSVGVALFSSIPVADKHCSPQVPSLIT
jgi:hypothetical protein